METFRFIRVYLLVIGLITGVLSRSEETITDEFALSELNFNREDTRETVRPCDHMSICNVTDLMEKKMIGLERRIRSLEQPVWKISSENFRWSACAEGPCKCYPESFSVNCWRLKLDGIPPHQTIPIDTAVLDMGSNMINAIHKHTFRGLTKLIQLFQMMISRDISDCQLDYLPDTIFDHLERLKYLVLHRNHLDEVNPAIFRDLKNLETLDLSENRLTSMIIPNTLTNLKHLQLAKNKLKAWNESAALIHLEDLDLSGNEIQTLGSFRHLRKLKRLKLGDNMLKQISADTFIGLRNLHSLKLEQNRIEHLSPNAFVDLGSVTEIDLSGNSIGEIFPENFNGLTQIKDLKLAKNELRTIYNGTFEALSALDRLSLHGNILETLEPMAFKGLSNLTWLLLGNNILSELSPDLFFSVPNLTRLELDSNDLLFIADDTFEFFNNLQSIKLGKNSWHCDCNILYLSNWIRDHSPIVLDYQPKCRGPTSVGGKPLHEMTFPDVCDGFWLSMQKLPSRVTAKKN